MQVERAGKKKAVLVTKEQDSNYFKAQTLSGKDAEFLLMDHHRSKLAAGLMCGMTNPPSKNDVVLYLGASAGYTVSFIAQLVPLIFSVEFSPVMARELVFLSETMSNVAPILADANQPNLYAHRLCKVDYLFQDISQKNQTEIFRKNIELYLKKGGIAVLSLKTRCIDFTKKPGDIFNKELSIISKYKDCRVLESLSIDKYEKDHFIIVVKYG